MFGERVMSTVFVEESASGVLILEPRQSRALQACNEPCLTSLHEYDAGVMHTRDAVTVRLFAYVRNKVRVTFDGRWRAVMRHRHICHPGFLSHRTDENC